MKITRTDRYDLVVCGGEAAGFSAAVAAALSKDGNFVSVDIEALRNTLFADGVLDPDQLPFN